MLPSYEPAPFSTTGKVRVRGLKRFNVEDTEFSSSVMLEFIKYVQRYERVKPRTYWIDFPFYIIVENSNQRFNLGYRPEDLSHIETIEKKALKKHQAHLNRLERFPLEKAEYYVRLKEAHGVDTVRALSKITGEDWSYIARILKVLDLPEQIKEFLNSNKNYPAILKFFHFRRLFNIVREKEERLQLARFNEFMNEFEESSFLVR